MAFADFKGMSIQQASRYAQIRLARRVGRSLPWIGAAIALYALGSAIRQKGLVGGTLDTALNAVPFVGGAKNVAEVIRGRDFIRDRPLNSHRDAYADSQRPTSMKVTNDGATAVPSVVG
ncbi:MAG TPA: hypothetical protein VIX63_05005 [Vicinamibacterales bacterium]